MMFQNQSNENIVIIVSQKQNEQELKLNDEQIKKRDIEEEDQLQEVIIITKMIEMS